MKKIEKISSKISQVSYFDHTLAQELSSSRDEEISFDKQYFDKEGEE